MKYDYNVNVLNRHWLFTTNLPSKNFHGVGVKNEKRDKLLGSNLFRLCLGVRGLYPKHDLGIFPSLLNLGQHLNILHMVFAFSQCQQPGPQLLDQVRLRFIERSLAERIQHG